MSVKNGKDYLYLIWKDEITRRQYVVGQLSKNGNYEFQYRKNEIIEAIKAGFAPLIAFEEINKVYVSASLFPIFSSRLPDRKRKDIGRILLKYGLKEYDAYELLKMSGARLPIDNLQFIDPILDIENEFERKFYMAGVRHYLGCDGEKCEKSIDVEADEELFLEMEPENTYDKNAIRVVNAEKVLLGYIPRYYSEAYTRLIQEKREIQCNVYEVNKNECCSECIMLKIKVL